MPPVADNCPEYGTPTLPLLSDPLRLSGASVTVSVTSLVATAPVLSATVTRKVKLPAVVGVPESVPLLKVVPGGRVPAVLKLYGATPPVPAKVMWIAVPAATGPVGPPVMLSGAAWMVMLKSRDPDAPVESVATAENGNWPGVFGVP